MCVLFLLLSFRSEARIAGKVSRRSKSRSSARAHATDADLFAR
jgi:hypothetical protein